MWCQFTRITMTSLNVSFPEHKFISKNWRYAWQSHSFWFLDLKKWNSRQSINFEKLQLLLFIRVEIIAGVYVFIQ